MSEAQKYFLIGLLSAIFLTCLLHFCRADSHYVATNGLSSSPYLTWANAATDIQWAVDASTAGDTVWVSNGVYSLTNQISITDGITLRSVNGSAATLLDGNNYAGKPVTNRCMYLANANAVVDGFTMSNGYMMVSNNYSGGGGAYVWGGIVQNCDFVYNVCSNAGNYSGGGGAYVAGGGILSNCLFLTNKCYYCAFSPNLAGAGGAIYLYNGQVLNSTIISNIVINAGGSFPTYGGGIYSAQSSAVISNCFIARNRVVDNGGGVCAQGLITDCIISNNYGLSAGGIFLLGGIVRNSAIINNIANLCGGVRIYSGSLASNCVISGNIAQNISYDRGAGGILIDAGQNKEVVSCWISNNTCVAGGYGAGGITITNNGQVRNCLISNNTNLSASSCAGGVFLANAAANTSKPLGLLNCTIVNNYSTNEGGGVTCIGTSNNIVNCVIANNGSSSGNYPNVYHRDNFGANSSNYYYSCVITADVSLLAANQGNITNDPMFVNAAAGDWRLTANSPCVNAGTNQDWMTGAVDLDGNIRIDGGTVDMGAYEYQYGPPKYHLWAKP